MRVLICGCWSLSIHQGGIHSGNPSVLMRQVQPFCRKWVWWYRQSSVRLQVLRHTYLVGDLSSRAFGPLGGPGSRSRRFPGPR